ncbi:MAG: prepilin-type N-terminal cleavage/methylation domain-containing protein [Candidatus Zixiibacteriota bacterium]
MKIKKIKNQDGLTILEVLIASAVFMIGFSIMVFFLGEIIGKYSTKEYTIGYNLAQQYMENTIASGNFGSDESITEISNLKFKIIKDIEPDTHLKKVRISVIRVKTDKLMVSLYNEIYVR